MWPKKGIPRANPSENQHFPGDLFKLKSRFSTDQTNNAHHKSKAGIQLPRLCQS